MINIRVKKYLQYGEVKIECGNTTFETGFLTKEELAELHKTFLDAAEHIEEIVDSL